MKTQLKTVVFLLGLQLSYAQCPDLTIASSPLSASYDNESKELTVEFLFSNHGDVSVQTDYYIGLAVKNKTTGITYLTKNVLASSLNVQIPQSPSSSYQVVLTTDLINDLAINQGDISVPNGVYEPVIAVDNNAQITECLETNNAFIVPYEFDFQSSEVISIKEQKPVLFSVAPNPSSGLFNITTDVLDGEYTISVQNLLGQTVVNKGSGTLIDLTSQPKGMYLLVLETKTSKQVQKIQVN